VRPTSRLRTRPKAEAPTSSDLISGMIGGEVDTSVTPTRTVARVLPRPPRLLLFLLFLLLLLLLLLLPLLLLLLPLLLLLLLLLLLPLPLLLLLLLLLLLRRPCFARARGERAPFATASPLAGITSTESSSSRCPSRLVTRDDSSRSVGSATPGQLPVPFEPSPIGAGLTRCRTAGTGTSLLLPHSSSSYATQFSSFSQPARRQDSRGVPHHPAALSRLSLSPPPLSLYSSSCPPGRGLAVVLSLMTPTDDCDDRGRDNQHRSPLTVPYHYDSRLARSSSPSRLLQTGDSTLLLH